MDAPRVLVLGLGNDILTDDAVGLQVVELARRELGGEPGIEISATTEMGLALLDQIADRDALVLVDAIQTGATAGHVQEIDAEQFSGPLATSPHFLGIRETLVLGRMLGLRMPREVRILAIEVADPFTLGTQLTPPVAASVPGAAQRAVRIARELAGRVAAYSRS